MNEQRRQINQQPLKQEWSNCWTFQLCWTEVPYQRSRVYYFSLPRSHFLQEAHFQQFCKTNMLTWRMRKKSESKSSKLELEGSQGSCLISILPFPSNHRGRWGCWGSVMPSLSPLPPKNFRTRTSVKVNLSKTNIKILSSVSQFSCSVVSDSLRPHESQHARRPCPSPTPGVHSDSHPSSQWCHPAISFSVVPFSSCPQSLPASESFPMSQLFAWGGQSIGVSASASFLPKNTQDWSLEWTGWISLQSKGLSRVFSNTTV